jgi:hypothetical protein
VPGAAMEALRSIACSNRATLFNTPKAKNWIENCFGDKGVELEIEDAEFGALRYKK